MTSGRLTLIILAVAMVAIVAVLVSGGAVGLPALGGGGEDGKSSADRHAADQVAARDERQSAPDDEPAPEGADGTQGQAPSSEDEAAPPQLPDSPDEVRGSDSFALTRPANLRRALAVLDRRRRSVEGVFDGLRIAPGRIDTTIIRPDDRRTNLQVRPDLRVSFSFTHDFPTQADFRKGGLTARDVDPTAPGRLLRGIDRIRRGSAARDLDYVVVDRDIIDLRVEMSAFMRLRTARPRAFLKEPGAPPRAIG
jgi:hypothetical protein